MRGYCLFAILLLVGLIAYLSRSYQHRPAGTMDNELLAVMKMLGDERITYRCRTHVVTTSRRAAMMPGSVETEESYPPVIGELFPDSRWEELFVELGDQRFALEFRESKSPRLFRLTGPRYSYGREPVDGLEGLREVIAYLRAEKASGAK